MSNNLKASQQALDEIIDPARIKKKWNKYDERWASVADVSLKTLQRFWERKRLRRSNFIAICQAIEINDWKLIAEDNHKSQKIDQLIDPAHPFATANIIQELISLKKKSNQNSNNNKITKILVLPANPKETTSLRLASEVITLKEKLEESQIGKWLISEKYLIIESEWAINLRNIYKIILEYKPNIIHFSGHGNNNTALALENGNKQIQAVSSEELAGLFKLFSEQVECVLLKSCYSEIQVNAITEHIKYVISIKQEVVNDVAIEFIAAFYKAYASGETVESSYDLGCNEMQTAEVSTDIIPFLNKRSDSNLNIINTLVKDVREKVRESIQERCNTMRVLDMTQPIRLNDIYTDVNILEKLTGRRRLEIDDLLRGYNLEKFERFGLSEVIEERLPGIEAVQQYSKLMVLGKPGAGKTTFLKYLAIQCNEGNFYTSMIPVFVTLKSFTEERNQPDLIDYISQQFSHLNIDKSKLVNFLNYGRGLILLDGLDEVKEEYSSRTLKQIHEFSERFYKNNFVITCRIAAKEYTFGNFTEVEIADFNEQQITSFSSKWFCHKDNIKAIKFIQKITDNKPIKELATNPLLLTLLCIVFEETADFPKNRSELYKEGLDVLLKKWDAKRNIEREQIYKKLSIKGKEDLLSQIALVTFEKGEYFIKQRQLEAYISEYIKNLPDIENDVKALQLDSEAVLKSIEVQHGLLVERAREIYSFSHLTFHEYFTAREIVLSLEPQISLQNLVTYITEPRWREVFLLTAGMLRQADRLLILMKQEIDKLIGIDNRLLQFFNWVNQKALSNKICYKTAAVRWFYFDLARIRINKRVKPRSTDNIIYDLGLAISDAQILDPSFTLSHVRYLTLDFTLILTYALAADLKNAPLVFKLDSYLSDEIEETIDDEIEETIDDEIEETIDDEIEETIDDGIEETIDDDIYFYDDFPSASEVDHLELLDGFTDFRFISGNTESFLDRIENFCQTFDYVIKLALYDDHELCSQLEELRCGLPDAGKNQLRLKEWWETNGNTWINNLRSVMVEKRNIGHTWQFNKQQEKRLRQYYEAHNLLINCLNNGSYITQSVRKNIEESLLLLTQTYDEVN